MKSRLVQLVLAVVFLCGVFLVGRALFNIYSKKETPRSDQNVQEQLAQIRSEDLKLLQEGSKDAEALALSLRRYTAQNLPDSEELITKYIYDKRSHVRAAALESAGAYDWAAPDQFKEALSSSDSTLRVSALRGMAKRSEETRIALVNEFLRQGNLTPAEWLEAQSARYRLMPDDETKKRVEAEILAQAKIFNEPRRGEALSALFDLAPNSPQLKILARELLTAPGADSLAGRSLQYLSSFDREWLIKNESAIKVRRDHYFQLTLIDFLFAACPKNWEDFAKKMRNSPASPSVAKRLEETNLEAKCD